MLANIELYFIHGWGFNGKVWENWVPFIKDSVSPYIFDRGYFKTSKQNFSVNISARFKIVIAHSYGLHYLSAIDFSQIHMLVLLSSFRDFHEHSQNLKLSKKQIALMKQQLMLNPSKVLTDFYFNCGLKRKVSEPLLINQQLLQDDLGSLDNNQIDVNLLKPIHQILLLHGSQDSIVDIEHSKKLHNKLPNSKLFIHKNAGHSLPLTNSKWCLNIIQKQLSRKIFADSSLVSDNQSHAKSTAK